jgi:hypothetical protein
MPTAIDQFPHCDQLVLHGPKANCRYCNEHPEWQQLREVWGINFTGENDPEKVPCPATLRRSVENIHKWPGNRPKNEDGSEPDPEPGSSPKSVFERLRENPFSDE